MSKYFQFLLVIIYSFLAISAFFIVIDVSGWLQKPLRDSVVFGSIFLWLLFCFSAAIFLTGAFLFSMNVRKPVLEEEQKLLRCFGDIQRRANDNKRYRLMIEEEMGMNAFAIGYRTIVVTKGLMAGLTDSEIRSVMAHELGHLTSKDCIAGTAYFLTAYLPGKASRILGKGWRAAKTVLKISLSGGLLGVAIAIFLFYYFHILKYAGALFFYLLLLYLFNHLFGFLWSLNRRYTEYRQDAFAQKIGLGDDLRVALGKIIKNQPQKVSLFDILQSDYPIIHNRIRRLEKMEGLRE